MSPKESIFKKLLPLLVLFVTAAVAAGIITGVNNGGAMMFMRMFMAGFFLGFGGLKLLKLQDFVMAYQKYDIIARRSVTYAKAYPFIEIALGLGYLLNIAPMAVNTVTLVIMTVGAIGVGQTLARGEKILCVCMGAVFKLPMTKVTLAENVSMALMAAGMIAWMM